MMKKWIGILLFVLCSIWGSAQLSGTYTIGGTSPDYTTINEAVDSLESQGVSGAVILNIRSGVYSGGLTIDSIPGADSVNSVRFRTDPASSSFASITNTSYTLIFKNKVRYVSFDSLNITSTGSNVIYLQGENDHISFNGNLITGKVTTGTSTSDAVIYDPSGVNTSNISITNNIILNGSYAVHLRGLNTGNLDSGFTITGNKIKNFYYRGIFVYYNKNGVIDNNEIETIGGSNNAGILVGYSNSLSITANKVIMRTVGGPFGIYLETVSGSASNPVLVANNMVSNINSNSTTTCYYCSTCSYVNTYFNSFYGKRSSTGNGLVRLSSGTLNNFKNNSIFNNSIGFALESDAAYANDYNNLYGNVGSNNIKGATIGSNSITVNPIYVSDSNLHTSNVLLYQKGSTVSSVSTDIDGEVRSNPPCIGADEFVVSLPLSGTYTIGGTSPDYANFTLAVAALDSHGISGAVTFNVRSGTYTEQVTLDSIPGSSISNSVTFQKDPASISIPELQFTGTLSLNFVLKVQKADYVLFKGLRFKSTGTTYGIVLDLRPGITDIKFDSCEFIGSTQNNCSAGLRVITYVGDNLSTFNGISIENSKIKYGSSGLVILESGSLRGTNLLIKNNSFDSTFCTGIQCGSIDTVLIEGNSIIEKGNSNIGYWALDVNGCENSVQILKNQITLNSYKTLYGLYIRGYATTGTNKMLISNNVIIQTQKNVNDAVFNGIYIHSGSNYELVFNSVLLKADTTSTKNAALYLRSVVTNITIKNNLLVHEGDGKAITIESALSGLSSDYNNLFTSGDTLGIYNGTSIVNLSAWRTTTSNDANSISFDPLFIATDSLVPTSYFINDKGTYVSNVLQDINGITRSTSNPDIGAYEFSAIDPRLSGTYTIGGTTPDYLNFTAAVGALDSHGVKGTVIFNVRSGTYTEQIEIDSIVGASATNTITFQSQSGNATTPVLTFSGTSAKMYTLKFNGCDYLTIKYLKIIASGSSYANVLDYSGSTEHITIDGCILEGKNVLTGFPVGAQFNIVNHGGGSNNMANYCTIKSTNFKYGYYSIVLVGNDSTQKATTLREKGNQLLNNIFTSPRGRALELKNQDSLQVIGNKIKFSSSTSNFQTGIVVWNGDGDVNVSGNTIELWTTRSATGFQAFYLDGTSSNRALISNNSYVNKGISASNQSENGFHLISCNYIDLYYNTSSNRGLGIYSSGINISGDNYNLKNNLVSNSGGGVAISMPAMTSWTSDYNNFYTTGTNLAYYNGTLRTSFSVWKTVTSKDANSQNQNPKFIATDTLKPNNGDLNNLGITISGITKDIEGVTRNVSTPDIGAYEFTGVPGPMAGTYTIGGTSPDYDSIVNAVADLVVRGVKGPVKMYIRQGTYTEQITVDSIPGTSSTNTVTFKTDSTASTKAKITYNGDYTLGIDTGASYVAFDSLIIETTGSKNAINLFGRRIHHISFTGNKILGATTGYSSASTISDYYDNNASHLSFIGNEILNGYNGIELRGRAGYQANFDTSMIIEDNIIRDFRETGIDLSSIKGISIKNNIIRSADARQGISEYYSGEYQIIGNEVFITDNYGGEAIELSYSSIAFNNRSLVANNMFTSYAGNSAYGDGISLYQYFTDIVNNSFYTKYDGDYGAAVSVYADTFSVFHNNIIYNEGTGYAFTDNRDFRDSIEYNNIYSSSGKHAIYDLTGTSNISVNPLFVSDSNLRAMAPDLISRGKAFSRVSKDVDGVTRKAKPDIGINERTAPPNDIRVVSLSVPVTCAGNSAKVSVLLRNNGSSTLTSANVLWSISTDGGTSVSQTTKVFSGSLAPFSDTLFELGSLTLANRKTYTVTAYPTLPNGSNDTVNISDTATLVASSAFSGTYTIGGTTPNFLTVKGAVDTLKMGGICGPTRLVIRTGIYQESILMADIDGLSSTNTLELVADQANTGEVVIRRKSGGDYALRIEGVKHVTFDSLKFDLGSEVNLRVIELAGINDSITISNCVIEARRGSSNQSCVAIYEYTTDNYRTDHLKIIDNKISGGRMGIHLYGSSSWGDNEGTVIKNNEISHFYIFGISAKYHTQMLIENNYIYNGDASYGNGGISTSSCPVVEVRNNNVHLQSTVSSTGISIGGDHTASRTLDSSKVINNMVSVSTTSSSQYQAGIEISIAHNAKVLNNSVLFESGNDFTPAMDLYGRSNTNSIWGITIKNNSFVNLGGGYSIRVEGAKADLVMDYNNLYTSGTNIGGWNTTAKTDLAAWRSASSRDANSINVNPHYLSETDLHVDRPLLNKKGNSVNEVTDDYDGETRSVSTPDIGADEEEFSSNDAGIDTVYYTSTCGGASTISARLVNYGENNLNSATVNWTVATNSGSAVTQTPKAVTLTLAPGFDTTVVLGTVTSSGKNQYHIVAFSSNPNSVADTTPKNDTSIQTMQSQFSGSYTVGGTSPDYATVIDAVDALKKFGVCGPVVMNIRSGSYSGQVELENIEGLSSTNTLLFQRDSTNTVMPIIKFNNHTEDNNYTIKFSDISYVTLRNLEIQANDSTGSYNVAIELSDTLSHITIDSCGIKGYATGTGSAFNTISKPNGNENYLTDFTLSNSIVDGGSTGLYLYGSSSSYGKRISIIDNEIKNFYYRGLTYYYTDSITVENNHFYNDATATGSSFTYGVQSFYSDNVSINANKIELPKRTGYGLYLYSNKTTDLANGLVSNNSVLMGNDLSSSSSYGVYMYSSKGLKFYNNTVFVQGNSDNNRSFYYFGPSSGDSNHIVNNIFCAKKGYCAYLLNQNLIGSLNYNNYYSSTSSSKFASVNGDKADLSSFKSATGKDANSLSIDPKFVVDTLKPENGLLDSMGTVLSEITVDIDGNTRNATHPDMGAYEFVGSIPCFGLSGTYTVGGTSPYFSTIKEAIDSLTIKGVCDSVTFHIRPGTYDAQYKITAFTGMGASNPVEFRRDPSLTADVILKTSGATSGSNYILWLDGVSNLSFSNLKLDTNNNANNRQLYFTKAVSWVTFDSCYFNAKSDLVIDCLNDTSHSLEHFTLSNSTILKTDGSAISLTYGESNSILNNTINGFGKNGGFAIKGNGTYGHVNDSLRIIGNYIKSNETYQISSNAVHGINLNYAGDYGRISKNQVYIKGAGKRNAWGILCSPESMVFDNNVFSVTGKVSWKAYAYYSYPTRRTSYYYNTFYTNTTNLLGERDSIHDTFQGSNLGYNNTFKNNIFVNEGTANAFDIAASNTTSDYNNIYAKNQSLSAWQSANSGLDVNSDSLNPLFCGDTLIPGIRELVGTGSPIAGYTTDILDSTRNASTPTVGAYEYTYKCRGLAGTYTIGGTSPDYTTISEAVEELNCKGICDDVTFNIRQGTYTDSIVSTEWYNSPDSGWVTFRADPANTADVILSATLNSSSNALWKAEGTDHFIFDSINFVTTSTIGKALFYQTDSTLGSKFLNCSFDATIPHIKYETHNTEGTDSLIISDCKFENCNSEAIFIQGNGFVYSKGSRIINNTFENNNKSISIYGHDSIQISNNIINGSSGAEYGLILQFFSNLQLYNNDIRTRSDAITIYRDQTAAGTRSTFKNNVIYSKFGNVLTNTNISSGKYDIYFNTFISENSPVIQYGISHGAGTPTFNLVNNNLVNTGSKAIIESYGTSSSTNYLGNYNNYYSNADTLFEFSDIKYSDLSAFSTGFGTDTNSLSINPRFLNDSTLIPRVSELESAGTPITGITTDIRDSTRSTTAPSIGAYEYTYVCDGLSGVYTVGGTSPDYASISAAVADLNLLGICDDVTFNIRQGTYTDSIVSTEWYNSPDSGWVTFQADPANTDSVILKFSFLDAYASLWKIQGSDHLRIKGLHFKTTSSNGRVFLGIESKIIGFEVESCSFNSNQGITNHVADLSYRSDSIKIQNSVFEGGYRTIHFYRGGGESFGGKFTGNTINNAYFGLWVSGFDSAIVSDNVILNCSTGIMLGRIPNCLIFNNKINGKAGIGIDASDRGPFDFAKVYNNEIISEDECVRQTYHRVNQKIEFSHNSMKSTDGVGVKFYTSFSPNQSIWKNNVISSKLECLNIHSLYPYSGFNNSFYSESDTQFVYGSNKYLSLAAFSIANNTDTNSLFVNPRFKTDTLIPRIPDLETAGTPIAGITTDIRDSLRSSTAPSIGAYEYTYVCDGLRGVYTIDPARSASALNYTSITSAVADLNSLGICNDVTFNIKQGTYNESMLIEDIYNVGDSGKVVFQLEPSDTGKVVVTDTVVGAGNGLVEISGKGYLTFKEIEFSGYSASSDARTIAFKGDEEVTNIMFDSCKVYSIGSRSIYNSANGIDSLFVNGCTFSGGLMEILSKQQDSAYASFTNNTFTKSGNIIQINFDFLKFSGNKLGYKWGSANAWTRIGDFYSNHLEYYNNYHDHSTRSTFHGVRILNSSSRPGVFNVYNNVFNLEHYPSQSSLKILDGLSVNIGSNDSSFVHHNTLKLYRQTKDDNGYGVSLSGGNHSFKNNNVFVDFKGIAVQSSGSYVSSNNNIYTLKDTIAKVGSTYYTSLSQLNSDSYETNSTSLDPYFKSDSLLLPTRYSLDNRGISIASVQKDILNFSRTPNPDIGAYQFQGVNIDVEVHSVKVDTLCAGSHTLSAWVKNISDSTITSSKVSGFAKVSGGLWTELGVLTSTDTIQKGDSILVRSANPFNFVVGASYEIKMTVDTLNGYRDNDPTNNTSIDTVAPNAKPTAVILSVSACDGDSLKLVAGGGKYYEWFGVNSFVDSVYNPVRTGIDTSFAGAYTVIVRDSNYCIDSTTTTVSINEAPVLNLPNDSSICSGKSITISVAVVDPQAKYLWSNSESSPSITVDSASSYSLIMTALDGCRGFDTMNLTIHTSPDVKFNKSIGLVCTNSDPIDLNIAIPTGGSYSSSLVQNDTLYPGVSGSFPLKYTYYDTNGCGGVADTTVIVKSTPIVALTQINDRCINGGNDTITEHSPKGGVFFGSTSIDSVGIYKPKTKGVGLDSISYYYVAPNGCSDTASQYITINDTIDVVLTDINLCENSGTILLDQAPDASAAGLVGNYYGSSALSGNYYNPSVKSGSDTLNYTVLDTNNCISRGSRVISLDTIPIVSFANLSTCFDDSAVALSGLPSGGKFWGRGVANDSLTFLTAVAGIGLDTLTYAYTLPSNGCSDTVSNTTLVNSSPKVSFNLPDSVVVRCIDAVPFTLSGYSPLGGVFSGIGLDSSKTQFLSDSAGAGNHVITYTYEASNLCVGTATDTIRVNALPIVSFTALNNVCLNADADTLKGGLPLGGIYGGTGVDSNGLFNPLIAGVGTGFSITYSYVDSNGCSNYDTSSIAVDSLTPISLGLIPDYCINSGIDSLVQGAYSGSSNLGSYKYTGKGVVGGNKYDPIQSGLGKDTIWYVYTNTMGCSDSLTQTITVNDSSVVTLNVPSNLQQVCKNEPAFVLGFGSPGGGTYQNHPAISSNKFNPKIATVGNHTLVYSYTNSNSCVTSASATVRVDSVPVVSVSGGTFCLNDGNQTLKTGTPLGGKFTGSGMINDSIFSPSVAGTGSSILRYTYTVDTTGCSSYADTTFVVNSIPTVSFSSLKKACENRAPYNLNAGITNGTYSYYTGKGITDTANGSYNPSIAGVGIDTITYTGVNALGCSNSLFRTLQVDSVPLVNLDTLPNLCRDSKSFLLTIGSPISLGTGIYSGKGVNGTSYYPSLMGVGKDTITYQFTDRNGCSSSDTITLDVNPLPVMTAANWSSLCLNNDSFALNGALPVGGIYSSNKFVDSASQKFAPDSVGVFTIKYAVTDSNNCSNSVDQFLQVRALPSVQLTFANSLCKNIAPVVLNGGSPIGSTGKYSGKGVRGNSYYPDSAQGGIDTLWYAYTDAFTCTDSAYQIIKLDSAAPIVSSPLPELCKGAPDLNLAPYYSPTGGTFSGTSIFGTTLYANSLNSGSYPVRYSYKDTNKCITYVVDTVYIRPNPSVILSNDTAICDGESVDLSASGGVSYSWNTGDQSNEINQSPDTTNLYIVTVTNQFNCESTGSILVTVHENYSVFTSSSPSACGMANGIGYITVNRGKSPFQYYWSDGERNAQNTGLVAGSYTVTVEDANSCEQYATVDVVDEGAPSISLDSLRNNRCSSDTNGYISLGINPSNNVNIRWSNGMTKSTISGLNAGIYSVRVVDTLGCASAQSFEIKAPKEFSINSLTTSPDCDSTNGGIIVKVKGATPGYTYNWIGQSSTRDTLLNVGAGVYSLVVQDINQCIDTFDFSLGNQNRPLFKLDSISKANCGITNGGVFITPFDTIQGYKWSNGATTQNINGLSVGRYFVTLTDTSGCKSVDAFDVLLKTPVKTNLCYVTYDSTSTYNKIVWDTTGTPGVSGFSVLRESSSKGKYFELGKVSKGSNPIFIDSSMNTAFNFGNYAVKTYDNCNSRSEISEIHKSVLLSTKKVGEQIIQLNWSSYEGLPVNGFYIFRYSTSGGFKLLDSTSAVTRSYNDFNVLSGEKSLFYFVMVRSSGPCTPSGSVISNYSTDFGTGVSIGLDELTQDLTYSIFPNPNAGNFFINFNQTSNDPVLLRLYDVRGKIILEKTLDDVVPNEPYSLKLLDVSDGLYYLQVVSNGKVNTTQIVINR